MRARGKGSGRFLASLEYENMSSLVGGIAFGERNFIETQLAPPNKAKSHPHIA